MVDDNTQINAGQVDDGQVDDSQSTDDGQVDITKQSDSDFMDDTVKEIKETQKAILEKDNSDTTDNTQQDDNVLPDLAGQDIPDAFTSAAEAAGMSPEDIIAFADKHTDEQLMEMIPTLEASLEKADDDKDDEATKQDDKKDKDVGNKDIDPEIVKSITEKISKQLEDKFGATLEEIDKFKAHQEEQSTK